MTPFSTTDKNKTTQVTDYFTKLKIETFGTKNKKDKEFDRFVKTQKQVKEENRVTDKKIPATPPRASRRYAGLGL